LASFRSPIFFWPERAIWGGKNLIACPPPPGEQSQRGPGVAHHVAIDKGVVGKFGWRLRPGAVCPEHQFNTGPERGANVVIQKELSLMGKVLRIVPERVDSNCRSKEAIITYGVFCQVRFTFLAAVAHCLSHNVTSPHAH